MVTDQMMDYMQGYFTPEFDRKLFALSQHPELKDNPTALRAAQEATFLEAWDAGVKGGRRETSAKALAAKAARDKARRRNYLISLRNRVLPDTLLKVVKAEQDRLNVFRVPIVERADLRGATEQEMTLHRYTALALDTLRREAIHEAEIRPEAAARQARRLLFLASLTRQELDAAREPGRSMPADPMTGDIATRMSPARFRREFERRMDLAAKRGNWPRVAEFLAAARDMATRAEPGAMPQLMARSVYQRGFNKFKAVPRPPRRPAIAVRTVEEMRGAVGDLLGDPAVAADLDEEALRAIAVANNITRLYQRTEGERRRERDDLLRDLSATTTVPTDFYAHYDTDILRTMLRGIRQRTRLVIGPPPRLPEAALPRVLGEVERAYAARQRPITQADVMAVQRRIRDAFPVLSTLLPADRRSLTEDLVSRELMHALNPGASAEDVALRRYKTYLGEDPARPTTMDDLARVVALRKHEWRRMADDPTEPNPTYAGRLQDREKTPVQDDIKGFLGRVADAERRRAVAIGQELPAVPGGFFQ